MTKGPTEGVSLQVTRVALVVRLVSLLLVVLTLSTISPAALVGQILIGVAAWWLLVSRRGEDLVSRHPWLVFLDTLLLTVVTVLSGGDSPFVLTFMTSALLVGLWASAWVGFSTVAVLVLLHQVFWATTTSSVAGLAVPFGFVVLWWLGFAISEAGRSEERARDALQRAVAVAAAGEERTRLARDMHDTVAKSLQAVHLSAAALPIMIERDPAGAVECAGEIRELSAQAIEDVRALMTHLRREPEGDSLPEMLIQLCLRWEAATGISLVSEVDETTEVTDVLVRYEILMAMGEALENVRRHARASLVRVALKGTEDWVVVSVVDDGVGIDGDRLREAEEGGHYGRRGMAERMAKVGGRAEFRSTPGWGTTVQLVAPRHGLIEVE
ncbi:MAG: histidine kinase [Propioniciclava sp.]